jgi:hypothetical protein
LEKEMAVFPKGANDDTLDALAYQNDIAEPPIDEMARVRIRADRQERKSQIKSSFGL